MPNVTAGLSRPTVAEPSSASHPAVNRRRVVVYLEAAPRQAFGELPPSRARMDQRAEQFVATRARHHGRHRRGFPEQRPDVPQRVLARRAVRTFDLGRFAPGRTGSVRFDRPGIVPVFCDIHSHMSAYILVFSHPFFAVSDDDGQYVDRRRARWRVLAGGVERARIGACRGV